MAGDLRPQSRQGGDPAVEATIELGDVTVPFGMEPGGRLGRVAPAIPVAGQDDDRGGGPQQPAPRPRLELRQGERRREQRMAASVVGFRAHVE